MKCSDCHKKQVELDSYWDRFRLWFFHFFHNDILDLSSDKFTEGFGEGYIKGFESGKERAEIKLKEFQALVAGDNPPYTDWFVKTESVLAVDHNRFFLGKEELTDTDKKNLVAEVKALKNFKIWAIFQETLRQKAIDKAMLNSTKFEEVLAGKMMVHSLGIFKSIVDLIDKNG